MLVKAIATAMVDAGIISSMWIFSADVVTAKKNYDGVSRGINYYPYSEDNVAALVEYYDSSYDENTFPRTFIIFDDIAGTGLEKSKSVKALFTRFRHKKCWVAISSQEANSSLAPVFKGNSRYIIFSKLTPSAEHILFKDFVLRPTHTFRDFTDWRDTFLTRFTFGLYDSFENSLSLLKSDALAPMESFGDEKLEKLFKLALKESNKALKESNKALKESNKVKKDINSLSRRVTIQQYHSSTELERYRELHQEITDLGVRGFEVWATLANYVDSHKGTGDVLIKYDDLCEATRFFFSHPFKEDGTLNIEKLWDDEVDGFMALFDGTPEVGDVRFPFVVPMDLKSDAKVTFAKDDDVSPVDPARPHPDSVGGAARSPPPSDTEDGDDADEKD